MIKTARIWRWLAAKWEKRHFSIILKEFKTKQYQRQAYSKGRDMRMCVIYTIIFYLQNVWLIELEDRNCLLFASILRYMYVFVCVCICVYVLRKSEKIHCNILDQESDSVTKSKDCNSRIVQWKQCKYQVVSDTLYGYLFFSGLRLTSFGANSTFAISVEWNKVDKLSGIHLFSYRISSKIPLVGLKYNAIYKISFIFLFSEYIYCAKYVFQTRFSPCFSQNFEKENSQ